MTPFAYLAQFKWGDWFRMLWSVSITAAMGVLTADTLTRVFGAREYTPRQLLIMAGVTAVGAAANFVQKNPWPERAVAIALLPGVHTQEDVHLIAKATSPGTVPTKETAAAIMAEAQTNGGNGGGSG